MVLFAQNYCYLKNLACISAKLFPFGEIVVFGQDFMYFGIFRGIFAKMYFGKMVLIGHKKLRLAKTGSISGTGCIWAKMVVSQLTCLYLGYLGYILAKWLYFETLVVFRQNWLILGKQVVFTQSLSYLGNIYEQNSCLFGQN